MNLTINNNDTTIKLLNGSLWFQQFQQKFLYSQFGTSHQRILRPQQQRKRFSYLQMIEICLLYFILMENLIIFILTYQKKLSKQPLFNTNDPQQQQQQSQQQSQQHRSIIFPSKSVLYNCLHRNWIRAYSFSNVCLSLVYFIILIIKHYHPNLLHYSSITFYSLPLTLVQQILINFSTFHLFIISISILQYFIRYYRLIKNKYTLNAYNGKNLLITKHTNVALILSGSLALIFGYNYIFYTPKHSQTIKLLPLITLNMILLPLIDFIIFIFIIVCCIINLYKNNILIEHDILFDSQLQQQQLTNNIRSTVEKSTCTKCYTKFLQQNRNIFQDTDPYTSLHSQFFGAHRGSSTLPSLTRLDDKRKYSTISYENIPMINDYHSRLRASYPGQTNRNFNLNKCNHSQQDFSQEQQMDIRQNSTNDLFLQTTLIKLKRQRSSCHLCYRLLLLFLLKYVLCTFPQHIIQMLFHLKQFYEYIIKDNLSNNILFEHNELILTICRFLFLFGRFGDSLLLTHLPNLIKKYFPCWCHFNSKLLCKNESYQRPSHQILVKNTDSSIHEPLSGDNLSISNDLINQQELQQQRQNLSMKEFSHTKNHHFRLRFQFVPIWSNKRPRLFKENC
ncbi:unnamed protein product [Rotaria sordida]|uniref:Uncharacterized protein n=1 Tax=Rotaria sordida TaxID=392033 RepID=A0A813QWV8_9BILA|nr:unnamed protein product [Rotaria sordida]CAF0840296.1 unnamed protein product [Rotaria sordida]CAF3616352.1 unnamed protein product [Rotaria sordida]CAF3706049.1 unnamed protein product [Rotaria sordida]